MFGFCKCGSYPARNHETVLNTFFTPDEYSVKDTASRIVDALVRDTIEDRVAAAFNFIVSNITYTSDKKQFGKNDWWQYPNETLSSVLTDGAVNRMYGDCEDSSFLFASLLIALGIPSSNVRVGVSGCHAWVECKLGNTWYLFETTNDSVLETFIPASSVVGSSYSYKVKVYVYQGGCRYGR